MDSSLDQNMNQANIDKTIAKLTELNLFDFKKNIEQKVQETKMDHQQLKNDKSNKMYVYM